MAVDAGNARIFGSDDDKVSIGDIGATLPTALTGTLTGFTDAGWLGPDGIDIIPSDNIEKFRGHQGGRVVRVKVTESDTSFKFQCLETTALTLGLQYNVKSKATASGVTSATVSSGRKVEARSFVVDVFDADDADIHYRYVVERGEIGERSEFKLSNKDITAYEYTVEIIGDFFIITNDPAFEDA